MTNHGSEGIDAFTPVLNPPEVLIVRAGRVREQTDRTALFDRLPHTAWYRAALDQFLDLLNPSTTDVLLDVGSGSGWFALWAGRRAGSVIGVDRILNPPQPPSRRWCSHLDSRAHRPV